MLKINGFTEEHIINKLYLAIELAGDGGPAAFDDEEYKAMREYLNTLESKLSIKNTVECYECDKIVHYTDEDVENGYVLCPCCRTEIILLD